MCKQSKMHELKISGVQIYQGFLRFLKDEVLLMNGIKAHREYIDHPGGAMIIPLLPNGNVIMEKQFRYATQTEYLEFPAGGIGRNEAPIEAARRELLEETGYEAHTLVHLTTLHPAIGYSSEVIEVYWAQDLIKKEQNLDHGELLEIVEISPAELFDSLRQSKILDAKTQIGAFWLEKILKNEWTLKK